MRINYLKTEFIINAEENIYLPLFKGSAFRGLFGNIFRRLICVLKKNDCTECLLRSTCVYSYIFETFPSREMPLFNREKYRSIPQPFIIEPPLEEKRLYKKDEEIYFALILIGKATTYLPYFIYTFEECGKTGIGKGRGKFKLKRVLSDGMEIYNFDDKKINRPKDSVIEIPDSYEEDAVEEIKTLKLKIITPVRIKHERKYISSLTFPLLIKALITRMCFLSYYHCDGENGLTCYKRLFEESQQIIIKKQNTRWWDWERYSSRQNTRMKLGGVIGEIEYEGKIKNFLPLLKAGEILHVGKNTGFGLGKYDLVIE